MDIKGKKKKPTTKLHPCNSCPSIYINSIMDVRSVINT